MPVVAEIMGWELMLVIAVVAHLFGSTQISKLARSLGSTGKDFEEGLRDEDGGASVRRRERRSTRGLSETATRAFTGRAA